MRISPRRFEDAQFDREFVISNNMKAARQARTGFFVGSIGYLVLGIIVYFIDRAFFDKISLFLFVVVLPTHLLAAIVIKYFEKVYLMQWILVFANIFSGCCIFVIGYFAPVDFAVKYGYGLVIAINLYGFSLLRMRFFFASIASTSILLLYFFFLWYFIKPDIRDLVIIIGITSFINTIGLISTWFFESFSRHEFMQAAIIQKQREELSIAHKKSEDLLLNMLPRKVAKRLLAGETAIADRYSQVSVLFADIEGFTSLSRKLDPELLVSILNNIFSKFDEAAQKNGLEKIKTIGDAYMAASGLPEENSDHASKCVAMGLDMLQILQMINSQHDHDLKLRLGIATGPVVAGVIGRNKFIFDLWGETVNLASRLESTGIADSIHIDTNTMQQISSLYSVEPRGDIEMKGIGKVKTFLVKS